MRFFVDSDGPGRVIDRRGQGKPKGWKDFDGKYKVSDYAGRYDKQGYRALGLKQITVLNLNRAPGKPKRSPMDDRKRPRG